MSSVLLLRDHEDTIQDRKIGGKKGDIVSVPWTVRKELLKKGIASDLTDGVPARNKPQQSAEQK